MREMFQDIKNVGTTIVFGNLLITGLCGANLSFSDSSALMGCTLEVGHIWGIGYRFSLEQDWMINTHI